MKKLVFPSLFFSLVIASNTQAAINEIASVVKSRGLVTKLMPGAMEASKVEAGDKLSEDTSIVTGPKSFVKIKFIDQSELNVGPESKIVISEMKSASSAGIISLLKGRIRTQVEKNQKGEDKNNKFFIRTRTAALGVRGTDFQTIYNPDNRMTSLLTYEGSVAMAKIDKSTHKLFEEGTKEVVRNERTNNPEVKDIQGKQIDEKTELQKVLNSSETVIVPPGQNSFASDALVKSSQPVKISPLQLNALYKNNEFDEKNVANLRSGLTATTKIEVTQADQVAPAEGFYDSKTGDFAPRAGGFIDENTGLYVAPDNSAVLDPKSGTYRSEKTGDIDADTGQYVAPKGLTLDAKRGFVLTENKDAKPELLALREDLNKSIARDLVVGNLEGELALEQKNIRERFIRNRLVFTLAPGDETIELNKDENRPYYEFKSKDVVKLGVDWQFASTNRFTPILGIGYSSVDFDNLGNNGNTQDSGSLFNLSVGVKYALSKRFDLYTKLMVDQGHYVDQVTGPFPDTYILRRVVQTKLGVGSAMELFRNKQFYLKGDVFAGLGFRKRFNNLVVRPGLNFKFKIMPEWAFSDKKAIALGLVVERQKNELNNNFGINTQDRSRGGLELNYILDI